jgi:hypothetical protein
MHINFKCIVHLNYVITHVDKGVPCEYYCLMVETCRGYVNGFIQQMHDNAVFDGLCILLINVLSGQNAEFCNFQADYLTVARVFLRC